MRPLQLRAAGPAGMACCQVSTVILAENAAAMLTIAVPKPTEAVPRR
jgi:hypothetical protein